MTLALSPDMLRWLNPLQRFQIDIHQSSQAPCKKKKKKVFAALELFHSAMSSGVPELWKTELMLLYNSPFHGNYTDINMTGRQCGTAAPVAHSHLDTKPCTGREHPTERCHPQVCWTVQVYPCVEGAGPAVNCLSNTLCGGAGQEAWVVVPLILRAAAAGSYSTTLFFQFCSPHSVLRHKTSRICWRWVDRGVRGGKEGAEWEKTSPAFSCYINKLWQLRRGFSWPQHSSQASLFDAPPLPALRYMVVIVQISLWMEWAEAKAAPGVNTPVWTRPSSCNNQAQLTYTSTTSFQLLREKNIPFFSSLSLSWAFTFSQHLIFPPH